MIGSIGAESRYSTGYNNLKPNRNQNKWADTLAQTVDKEDISSRADINRAKKSTVMDSYLALSGKTINTLKQEYSEYESENYRIVPDNEAECFDIYNKDGGAYTYETRYNEIVKEHEKGDREVSYELTGKRSLTLDEDLAGLDEAFKMRLANLEGYITCQQTNKAFENADSSWYFRRNSPQNEVKTQDKAQMFDTKYQKTAVSIMEQAKEKFLVAFKSINYKQGTATSILSDIMKKC